MEKEQEILEKAREMFMTYGLRSITMDDLAREIGISKKTLYQHYKDKADLIKKIVHLEVEKMTKLMESIFLSGENTIDRMIKINKLMIEMKKNTPKNVQFDLEKYYPDIAEEINEKTENKMFKAIKQNHEIGIKEGLIRNDLDTNIIAVLQLCRSNYSNKFTELLPEYDDEKILNEIFEYHIRGIATPKGIEYFQKNYSKK
ncbi:MAG: TetR/AcrR family transcriptional regulator [Bacteroidales bacterium]|nr:TetR/AcrR family transcriptional regulator [Bacteroidales bacterium]